MLQPSLHNCSGAPLWAAARSAGYAPFGVVLDMASNQEPTYAHCSLKCNHLGSYVTVAAMVSCQDHVASLHDHPVRCSCAGQCWSL